MPTDRIELPLLVPAAPSWNGLQLLPDTPEPRAPQGAYGEVEAILDLPPIPSEAGKHPVELLAPAGGPDAAFAAFHFGADAIYLGLKKFSARAEAENFTLDEVDEITAYAHSLEPRRRVFVTINTLIRQDELPELVETLAALADIGVDALIMQDLGVYHLVRRLFSRPGAARQHAVGVHNRAGAEVLHRLGFRRVVLARELTFEEVRDITATAGIETEVFIHGALCYSYSGLCLFSSQTLGRSGNRGKCAYSCRDSFEVDRSAADPARRLAGQARSAPGLSVLDEGPGPARSPAGTAGRRRVVLQDRGPQEEPALRRHDHRLLPPADRRQAAAEERPAREADLQTVFSRPWTRLFVQSHKDKEVADRDTVGHRGTPIGSRVVSAIAGNRLRFRTSARPGTARRLADRSARCWANRSASRSSGCGWSLWPARKRQEVFEAPAGAMVEVSLPGDHPQLPLGAPVYCSSSQAVKRKYRYSRPKPGLFRTRKPVDVELVLTEESLKATGRIGRTEVVRSLPGPFAIGERPGRDGGSGSRRFRQARADSALELTALIFRNESHRFVPVSRLEPAAPRPGEGA